MPVHKRPARDPWITFEAMPPPPPRPGRARPRHAAPTPLLRRLLGGRRRPEGAVPAMMP